MTLAILSSCSIAVALTGIFLGVFACARHLRRIADVLRVFGERDMSLVIKKLKITAPQEETPDSMPEGRPQ